MFLPEEERDLAVKGRAVCSGFELVTCGCFSPFSSTEK